MMLRVYFLPVETVDGAEQVMQAHLIHDAILECTEDPAVRKLIMDTTTAEHDQLAGVAIEVRPPTQEEIDRFDAREVEPPPAQDVIRAGEILATSPDVITQPEIWELLRILGRRLGY